MTRMMTFRLKNWNIEQMTGYKPKTTFYTDFSIADAFGKKAVKDTYRRAFREWKADIVFLTELCMVLNWKIWEHHQDGNDELARLYDELYADCDKYCLDNLKGSDLDYFLATTD